MWSMFTDFLCKIHQIGCDTSQYILHIRSPLLALIERGTQIIMISSILGMHCNRIIMRILQPTYEKIGGKGHLSKRVIVAGPIEWRDTLQFFVCLCVFVLFLFFVYVFVLFCFFFWCVGGCACVCVCVCDIHQFRRLILSYICEFSPPSDLVVGHPNNCDFIDLRNASLWEFRNQKFFKKMLERGTFFKG